MHSLLLCRIVRAGAVLAAVVSPLAFGFPSAQDLYVQPTSQPFIETPGETVVPVSVSSGSMVDAQSQLDAARAANPSAVIVLTLSGNYTVTTDPLTLPSHVCLVFASGASISAGSGITAPALIQVTNQINVSIAGGALNGNAAAVNAIRVTTSDRVHIDHLTISNFAADAIVLTGHGNGTFDNECSIARTEVFACSGRGLSVSSATQAVLVDNFSHHNGTGIYVGSARSTIVNNRCVANTVGIVGSGNDNCITDNTVDANGTGIAMDSSSNNNICSSNVITNTSGTALSDAGVNDTLFQNVFASNTTNLVASGTGANVIAWRGALAASGQNYFYPPLIDDQHVLTTIMNGKGRTDVTVGAGTLDAVQTAYNAAVSANPGNVIVLHLTGATYTVGANPLTLSSNTVVLLNGTIQVSSSTSASAVIRADAQSYIALSGGTIDGGNRTGKNSIYITNGKMIWVDKMTLQNFGPSNPRVGGSDVVHFSGGSTPYLFSRNIINGGAARGVWAQLSGQKSIYTDNDCSNVNQDGIDCDSNTIASLCKFNNCHDNVRYGIFFEQGAPYNVAVGNTVLRNGRGINVYNNALPDSRTTKYNTVACNLCDSNSNAIRTGSTGNGTDGTLTLTSHNFIFNNRATNSSGIGLEGDASGVQNYYSGNIATGNGTNIRSSGSEVYFNPTSAGAQAANPVFSPAGGSFVGPQNVSITSSTAGASIRYTTDGSTPSATDGTLYSGPISVTANTTLKAIAFATGYGDSAVTSASYAIQVAAPVFSLPSEIYSGPQTVTITTATPGASIRYTTDGSVPTSTTGTLYAGPITVSTDTTLKAIAYAANAADSTVTSASYVISSTPPVADPTFSPASGTYTTIQSVSISTTTSGASIRYTTDGSTPTRTVGTLYSGPISVSSTTTLKAIAFATGVANSAVTSASYTINLPQAAAPSFSPAGGTFTSVQSVTISTTTSGASIRYTTDGSTPTATTGTLYTAPVSVNTTTTLKAVAFATGFTPSAVSSATYTINIKVAAPVITPNGGAYDSPQAVTITTATSGASIRYTIDGSTPTSTTGTLYSGPITISSTATLNAIAFKTGLTNSDVSNSYFAIGFSYEAELLQFTPSADSTANISVETFSSGSAFASNYQYVTLNAAGVGSYIEIILQDIPAGTYDLTMRYKSHPTNRGILQLSVDGVNLGSTLDERASPATFSTRNFGVVHFSNFGDHVVRLTVVGKNSAATLYNLTADRFDLIPDKTAPVITVPSAITTEATSAAGADVTFSATATDNKDGAVPVTLTPASGSTFPLGTTTVTATATDFAGNTATKTFTVTVRDTTAPTLPSLPNLTVEATSPSGATPTLAGTATDLVSGNIPVVFSPASGSTFSLGTTTVTATATDTAGNSAQTTFTVTVVDTTPPALTLPANLTLEATSPAGAAATYAASATDIVSGSVPVTLSIPSGSTFALGTTTVTASATDAAGNTANGSFTVTVHDTTAPVLTLPANITLEATGPSGAVATFSASADDLVSGSLPVSFSQASGSTFTLGTTTVTVTATDATGNVGTGSFTVTVSDTTPPALTLPANITLEATGPSGAVATFSASATDIVSGAVPTISSIASGSTFPVGTTTVNVSATDAAGNTAHGSFTVTVRDTTAPVLQLPANLILEATGPSGAVATYTASATDIVSGNIPVTLSIPSGSTFPIGTTTVTASATDAAGNTATGSFTVTVRDTTAPVLSLPANLTLEATSASGAVATYAATATDIVGGSVPVVFSIPSGSTFPIGTTTVTATATDAAGNTTSGSFTVTVRDTTAPVFVSLTATPNVLWPPNKQMVDVTVTANVTDAVGVTSLKIVSVNFNELVPATSIWVTGPLTLKLQADRNGKESDRVYTINVQARDAAGNTTTRSVTVTVPHDQGN